MGHENALKHPKTHFVKIWFLLLCTVVVIGTEPFAFTSCSSPCRFYWLCAHCSFASFAPITLSTFTLFRHNHLLTDRA